MRYSKLIRSVDQVFIHIGFYCLNFNGQEFAGKSFIVYFEFLYHGHDIKVSDDAALLSFATHQFFSFLMIIFMK